jgi:RNA polymerase subunit RPABC4/transcription elongation factor Spt4
MNESLAHLHRALVDALAQRVHHAPNQPVTVAEIYQDLIPYRSVRTTLGFALNADYEQALLQLLAGDGGYARVEPAQVQEELRLELRSTNPNVGVFRNYAACDVFVRLPDDFEQRRQVRPKPEAADANATGRPAADAGGQTLRGNGGQAAEPALRPAPTPRPAAVTAAAPTSTPAPVQRPVAAVRTAEGIAACSACKRPLPAGRAARFCPFCGTDQTRQQCTRCREPLEQGWQFCVACGTPVA